MRRVVVTGLGLVTPLGEGVEANWQKLIAGESGVGSIKSFDTSGLSVTIGAEVPIGDGLGEFNADNWLEAKDQRKNDKFIIYAIAAASQAVLDSGWHPEDTESSERTGVMIGSGVGGLPGIYDASVVLHERGPRRISPFFISSTSFTILLMISELGTLVCGIPERYKRLLS